MHPFDYQELMKFKINQQLYTMSKLLHQKFLRGLLVFALFLTVTVSSGAANFINPPTNGILYVKKGLTGDGSSWTNALGEVAEALKIAKELNTSAPGTVTQIWVAGGIYKPLYRADNMSGANSTDRNNAFVVVKDVKMYGGFAGTETALTDRNLTLTANASILSGDYNGDDVVTGSGSTLAVSNNSENAIHVVLSIASSANPITNATVIDGFTIKGGNANVSAAPYINVNGLGLSGAIGGAMCNYYSSLVLTNSVVYGNRSISNSSAINNTFSSLIMNNVTISKNGGNPNSCIGNFDSSPIMTNIIMTDNDFGIYNATNSSPVITNAVIANNNMHGIYNDGATCNPVLTNVTITGAQYYAMTSNYASPKIRNCIIAGNMAGGVVAVYGQTNNAVITNSLVQEMAANGTNINGSLDPLFTNPAAGDYTLQACSPAINVGSNAYYDAGSTPNLSAVTTDLGGDMRIQDTTIDMGAYEFEPLPMHLTLQSTSLTFGQVCMNTNGEGTFVFGAVNMNSATLVVSALAGYSYSLTQNGTYTPTLTIPNYNNEVTTVYVRFTPTAIQPYNGTIYLAAQQNFACVSQLVMPVTGSGINLPVTAITGATATNVTITGASLPGTSIEGGCSPVSAYGIEYGTIATDVATGLGTQVPSSNMDISGNYTSAVSGLIACSTYYYRAYSTTLQGTVYGVVKSFTTLPAPTPVAIAAGSINTTGFTANWNSIGSAADYYLDVSTSPTFGALSNQTVIEDLSNIDVATTFGLKTWIGSGGVTWTANPAIIVLSSGIKAVRFRPNSPTEPGILISSVINGGTTQIKFKHRATSSTAVGGTFMVRILTGTDFTTVAFTEIMPYTTTLTEFTGTVAGVTGDYKIEISLGGTAQKMVQVSDISFDAIVFTPSFVTGYDNLNVGNVTSYPVTGLTANTQYYYRVRANTGCTSFNSNTIPVSTQSECNVPDPIVSTQTFCGPHTVADLQAMVVTGAVENWYTDVTGGTALVETATLLTGNYYVSQTVNGCESARVQVVVTVNSVPMAPGSIDQIFCGAHTVADLEVVLTTGATKKWYATATATEVLAETTALTTQSYFVSQTINGCESARTEIAVIVNISPAVTAVDQTICTGAVVSNLATTSGGVNVRWYTSETSTQALLPTDVVETGTYYVSQTMNACESPRIAVNITTFTPAAPTAVAQTFCGPATVGELLVATGTAPLWYTDATGGDALEETEALLTGSYFVSQTVNGCESPRTEVAVIVNSIPAAPIVSTQAFCGSATVDDLSVTTGMAPLWYADATGNDVLEETETLLTGTYYVSQTVNGCESERVAVTVTVNPVPATPGAFNQIFCGTPTVANLEVALANGAAKKWYASADATTALAEDTLLGSQTYFVSQTINGCESPRVEITVTVSTTQPVTAVDQTLCTGATASDLTTTSGGINVRWYASATETDPLLPTDEVTGGTYYVSQTINSCESARVAINVNLVTLSEPEGAISQEFTEGQTLANLDITGVEGATIVWYADEELTTVLPATTVLADGTTYYVVQQLGNCMSATIAVTVSETLNTDSFTNDKFTIYPNPVKDLITITYTEEISSVEVYNSLGQIVLTRALNTQEAKVDMSALAAGAYLVKVNAGNISKNVRIIKE